MYTLEIDVRPFPKERPRLSRGRIVYTPHKTRNFENQIAYEWKKKYKGLILKGAVKLDLVFVFKKAKSCKKTFHTQRPDIDNLLKSILDGLNKVAFVDDCQVVELNSKKLFASTDAVLISITEQE